MALTILAHAFAEWLDQNPGARKRAVQNGLNDGNLEHIIVGDSHEKILFRNAPILRKIGFDIRPHLLAEAKHALWADVDPLPDIQSNDDLGKACIALESIYTLSQVRDAIGVRDANTYRRACKDNKFIGVDFLQAMLLTVHQHRTEKSIAKANRTAPKQRPSSDQNNKGPNVPADAHGKLLSRALAQHRANTEMLGLLGDLGPVPDGDKANIVADMLRLCKRLHINRDALKRMADGGILTTANIEEFETLFTRPSRTAIRSA